MGVLMMNKLARTEKIDITNQETILNSCRNYINSRRSCYEFRAIRYEAVYDMLIILGLKDGDKIIDVGAGDGEFGKYLLERGFKGKYIPVDGMIDGTDLNLWTPEKEAEFFVSIEVIEHLLNPARLLSIMAMFATKGVVVTTPNPAVTNVYAMDATHISEVSAEDFLKAHYKVFPQVFFFEPEDSLLAWKDNR